MGSAILMRQAPWTAPWRALRAASAWQAVRPGLGIDLGTSSTVVTTLRGGVLLDQPSVIAARPGGSRGIELIASGEAALQMLGRSVGEVRVLRPVRAGAIADLEPARTLLANVIRRTPLPPWSRWRPRAVIAVPGGATALERQAFLEVADEVGLGHVDLVPTAVAGALGAGLDPRSRSAHLVANLGGGTSEVTAFGAGGILATACSRVGGEDMTAAVIGHLRAQHHLAVGEESAEALKIQALGGSAPTLTVAGVEMLTGRPRTLELKREEVSEAVAGVVARIVQDLVAVLDSGVPPQALADVLADGAIAFGAASLMPGLREALAEALGVRLRLAASPTHCVALGAAACLRDPSLVRLFSA